MAVDSSALYSTVKNTSGVAKVYGFLPPHGRTLEPDEEFTIFGDVRASLGGNRGSDRSVSRRDLAAFEAAIQNGDLQVSQTPSPILEDVDTGEPKMLQVATGAISAEDPDWFDSP